MDEVDAGQEFRQSRRVGVGRRHLPRRERLAVCVAVLTRSPPGFFVDDADRVQTLLGGDEQVVLLLHERVGRFEAERGRVARRVVLGDDADTLSGLLGVVGDGHRVHVVQM